MDIESHESALLLKESSPGPGRKRQGLALKLAVVLAGLALIVNLTHPMDTDSWPLSSIKEEKKVTAATEISPTDGLRRFPHRLGLLAWRDGIRRERVVWNDCRLRVRSSDSSIELPGRTGGCSGHRSRERREVGFL